MMKARMSCAVLMLAASMAFAQEPPSVEGGERAAPAEPAESVAAAERAEATERVEGAEEGEAAVKALSGMSILGNQEAPKSLVIVPWKSSEIGPGIGASRALDASKRPVDREVFMRELRYYQMRSGRSE